MEYLKHPICQRILLCFAIALGLDFVSRVFIGSPNQASKAVESSITNSTYNDGKVNSVEPQFNNSTISGDFESKSLQFFTINVLLCKSCGYSKKFEDLESYLRPYYPNATFTAAEYPVSIFKIILGYLLRVVQIAVGAVMLFGPQIFEKLQITPPPIYHKLVEKKMIVLFAVIFLGNNVHSAISSTSAFEVYLGNNLIHSKQATGEFPDPSFILYRLAELITN